MLFINIGEKGNTLMSQHTSSDTQSSCSCLEGNFFYSNVQTTYLSGDTLSGGVDLLTCKFCSRRWLSISYEPKIYDDDARWFRGLIDPEAVPAISQGDILQNALAHLENLDWYYTSGTYWTDAGIPVPFKHAGKIILWP